MYCHWRPSDAMPLLTQNGFWGRGMPTTSFRWFHLHSLCGATLFGSHRRHLPATVWHSLVGFRLLTFVCNAWQRSRIQNIQRVLENSSPISARLWTKVHEILKRCSRSLLLLNAFTWLSMSRFVKKKVAIKSRSRRKTEQLLKIFWPPILGRPTTPTFLQQIVGAIYCPPFGKAWLSFVCWCTSAKPGSEVDSRIYVGWVKMAVKFETVCGPKFMLFWDDVGDSL